MLTIRGTLQLNSLNPMKVSSDILSQKLLGNYQMMGLSIQPQDLLHMTMLPPEIYVGQGGEQYAVVNQNVTVNNSTKIEMVNQFLNRILLLDTQEFTYQDEVYISNFLKKIGITNIQEFIEVTRKQLIQNEQLTKLVEKYTENESQLLELVEKKQEIEKKEHETFTQQESKADIRYYLQKDIFNRLQTALLNKHIYANQKYISLNPKQITNQEFLLSEQMQLANKVYLTELKSKIFHDTYPCVYQHHYYYEQVPILEEQVTEQSVLKYLSAAILNNMVNKMAYIRLQGRDNIWNQWISYQKAFYGSSENTIIRFEDMHMQQAQRYYNKDTYVESVNELYKNELAALKVLEAQLEYKGEDYALYQVVNTLQQMQNHEKQAAEMIRLGSQIQILQDNRADIDIIEQLKKEDSILLENKQQFEQFVQREQALLYLQQLHSFSDNHTEQYVDGYEQKVFENENNTIAKQWIENRNEIQQLLHKEEDQNQFVDVEDYSSYLSQVNERNIQMYQKLQQMEQAKPAEKTILIDRKSALKKTLEILEHPEQSIEEFLEEGTAILPSANLQIQQILSLTEEPVRELYEKILYHIEEKNEGGRKVKSAEAKNQNIEPEKFLKAAMPFQIMEAVKEIERLQYATEENLAEQAEMPLIFEQTHKEIEKKTEEITEQESLAWQEIVKEQKQQTVHSNQMRTELEIQKEVQAVERTEIQPERVREYLQKETAIIQDKHQAEITERLEQVSRSNTDILYHVEESAETEDTIDVSTETKRIKELQPIKVGEYLQKETAVILDKHQEEMTERLEQVNRSNTDVLHYMEETVEKEASILVSEERKREQEELQTLKLQEYLQKEVALIQDKREVEMTERLEQVNRSNTDVLRHVEEFAETEGLVNVYEKMKREQEELQRLKVQEYLQKEAALIQDKREVEMTERLEQVNRSSTDVLHYMEEKIEKEASTVVSEEMKREQEELQMLKLQEYLQKEAAIIQDKRKVEMIERLEQMNRNEYEQLKSLNLQEYLQREAAIIQDKHRVEMEEHLVQEYLQRETSFVQNERQIEIKERLEQMNKSNTDVLRHVEEFVGKEDSAIISIETKRKEEEIQQISKETSNILKKGTQIISHNVQQVQPTQQVNLVHRNTEWQIEQQDLNELMEKKQTIVDYQQSQTELTEHITVLERKIQETQQEAIVQSKKSITELIQQNLQSQVNTISEQVYQKLEHRLWSERKRRGF